MSLLATCRLINTEARPFLESQLARTCSDPVRYIVDSSYLKDFVSLYSLLLEDRHNRRRSELTNLTAPLKPMFKPKILNSPSLDPELFRFIDRCRMWHRFKDRSGPAPTVAGEYFVLVALKMASNTPDVISNLDAALVNTGFPLQLTVSMISRTGGLLQSSHTRGMIGLVVARPRYEKQGGDDEKDIQHVHQHIQALVGSLKCMNMSIYHTMDQPTVDEWARDWQEGDWF
jgi:hypothetical protein